MLYEIFLLMTSDVKPPPTSQNNGTTVYLVSSAENCLNLASTMQAVSWRFEALPRTDEKDPAGKCHITTYRF